MVDTRSTAVGVISQHNNDRSGMSGQVVPIIRVPGDPNGDTAACLAKTTQLLRQQIEFFRQQSIQVAEERKELGALLKLLPGLLQQGAVIPSQQDQPAASRLILGAQTILGAHNLDAQNQGAPSTQMAPSHQVLRREETEVAGRTAPHPSPSASRPSTFRRLEAHLVPFFQDLREYLPPREDAPARADRQAASPPRIISSASVASMPCLPLPPLERSPRR